MTERLDLIVIGGGMAGLPLANKAAYKGLPTALRGNSWEGHA